MPEITRRQMLAMTAVAASVPALKALHADAKGRPFDTVPRILVYEAIRVDLA